MNIFCFHVYAQKCHVVKLSCCQVVKFDPWNMLNNFCFHVYAQKSLIIGEKGNEYFLFTSAPAPVRLEIIPLQFSAINSDF